MIVVVVGVGVAAAAAAAAACFIPFCCVYLRLAHYIQFIVNTLVYCRRLRVVKFVKCSLTVVSCTPTGVSEINSLASLDSSFELWIMVYCSAQLKADHPQGPLRQSYLMISPLWANHTKSFKGHRPKQVQ